ncbi:hypothetical protein GGP41_006655 [Bipolaris sorokiniana]|uniref:Uncharacterized protein n=1 Tax=Cochliobolus sativus TaxID=45130 RepID=A0A8H6DZK3_COCSA|nr:hypothetical protein GGP41_006655 [Bipolaris sorokiniana]
MTDEAPPTPDSDASTDTYQTHAPLKIPIKRKLQDSLYDSVSYMARMCFGAHILRQQEAGITDYTSHAQQDYQQDLTCMFAYAQSKGYFRKGTAARHLIPRLANITPRSRHDKIALVDEFVQHYESVQCDLLFIKDIITVNPQVDLDVVTTIGDCLSALHLSLAKGVKWRTIMPYTPLPKACLPMLRDFIANPKHFRFLGNLTHTVVDLETWLNPPPPCIEFLARLKVSVMDTSQQENEKTTGNPPPSPPPQDDSGTEPLAKLIEQGMEQVDLLADKVGLLEEQLQQAEIARTRITQNISVLEVTSAEQKAENTLKEERWVAAASQIRKEHCEHIARQNSEIERIKIGVDDERTRCVNVMANTSQMLAEANERINILASLPSGLPTSQPWNSPVDLDQSSDMMDIDQKTISSSNGFSAPNPIDPGNSNPLASYLAQDTTAHQHRLVVTLNWEHVDVARNAGFPIDLAVTGWLAIASIGRSAIEVTTPSSLGNLMLNPNPPNILM